jgi:pilus assembly protein Flp/PilA
LHFFRDFLAGQRGATSIEYGLICSLVVLAIIGSLNTFAGRAVSMLFNVSNAVSRAG